MLNGTKTEGIYRFADLCVKIRFLYRATAKYLEDYIVDGSAEFKIKANKRDIKFEEFKTREEGQTDFAESDYESMAILRKFEKWALRKDVLLFHASAVMVEGEAYVFAAPSGTGKSTHTALWRKTFGKRVQIINDDKPFVRMEEGRWFVYGSPWNGKHGLDNNVKAPLKAICFLEQAKENEISRIDGRDGFPRLCKQIFFPQDRRLCERAVGLAGTLSKVPMFLLKCNISEEAARMSYGAMRGE